MLAFVSSQTGIQVTWSFSGINILNNAVAEGDLGSEPLPARVWIAKILDSTQHNLLYDALYDMEVNMMFVNLVPALRMTPSVLGPKYKFVQQR